MIEQSFTLAAALILCGSAALAQSNTNKSSIDAPTGANGAAPTRDVGSSSNLSTQSPLATTSSSMIEQKNKEGQRGWSASNSHNTKP